MKTDWRISTINGALLAAYFVPAWTITAFKIMISPVHGLFDRSNISMALYVSDHLQFATLSTVRFAWLLALGKLVVVAFLTVFAALLTRPAMRRSGECDEPLWMGLVIGSAFSCASMLMALQVHEFAAMRLHAAELMLMLGAMTILVADFAPRNVEVTEPKSEAIEDFLQPSSAPNS